MRARNDGGGGAAPVTPPWPLAPTLGFILMLVSLSTAVFVSLRTPVPIVTGLPDDPDVQAARDLVADRVVVDADGLRFASSLGVATRTSALDGTPAEQVQRRTAAEMRLQLAAERHPKDARIAAALGHLALAGNELMAAESRYRLAISLAPSYGEARLGLGVALARAANGRPERAEARTFTLQALAQLAAVPERDPQYPVALANRILLLHRIGRDGEADRLAQAGTPSRR